jgi:hypothetical protein
MMSTAVHYCYTTGVACRNLIFAVLSGGLTSSHQQLNNNNNNTEPNSTKATSCPTVKGPAAKVRPSKNINMPKPWQD